MGRPATKPTRLKDGFYIEVKNKGVSTRMKMWSRDKEGMLEMARKYERIEKEVVVLGEIRKDKWVNENGEPKKKKGTKPPKAKLPKAAKVA